MAGKPKSMSQIKQLLQLHKQGKAKKEIARILGISKNTVKSYLRKVEANQLDIGQLIELENPVLEAKFHAGNPSYKEERYEHFKANVDYYLKELQRTGVTKQLLWEEYKSRYPEGYSHTQFCYHLNQQKVAARPSAILQHTPGDKLYIDFAGKTLSYIDPSTGEVIKCQVFVACLPYSDYCFAMAVRSQSVADFIYALTCCLHQLGGVPQALVPDNLKAAVVKADRYEPSINTALDDLANHYGTTVVPARVRKPKDKALVENQVKLIYSRVYAKLRNRQFLSLHELNKAISEKVLAHNQTRMQRRNYCREEKFLADEKHLLQPLPETTYEMKYYKEYKVAPNNHICLFKDSHYYSVPYIHIGKQAKVVYTRSTVFIYVDGQRVAAHARGYIQGGYTSVEDHLCSTHKHYRDRSPGYYMDKAKSLSEELRLLFEGLFKQGKYPEQLYRTCDGLLRLQRTSETDKFDKACRIALENGQYSFGFVKNILKHKMTEQKASEPTTEKPLPRHTNIRGKQLFY